MPSKNTSDSSCLCSNKTLLFVVVLRIVISQSTECSMCLFNVKLIVIFHVGTKWFAQGTPEFMTCDASQKTEHTMKTALLEKEKKKQTNLSLFILLSKILYYVEGAVFLYTTCMAPAALFFLKIFIFYEYCLLL